MIMETIKKKDFFKMKRENGRDLWNTYRLCNIAFTKFPIAEEISFCLTTGLWADITYKDKNGEYSKGRIFDSDPTTLFIQD